MVDKDMAGMENEDIFICPKCGNNNPYVIGKIENGNDISDCDMCRDLWDDNSRYRVEE